MLSLTLIILRAPGIKWLQMAANLFLHAMIFPHLLCGITTWPQAGVTLLRPVYSLHKQILKILDKKKHQRNITTATFCHKNTTFLSLSPPPLRACLASPDSDGAVRVRTWAASRGYWTPQFRKTTSISILGDSDGEVEFPSPPTLDSQTA